jgi:Rad3-related DNA helicase
LACRYLKQRDLCEYRHKRDEISEEEMPQDKFNLADLRSFGQRMNLCPFVFAQVLAERAEFVLAPYPYALRAYETHRVLSLYPETLVIFDEGHNVEFAARDSALLEIGRWRLKGVLRGIDAIDAAPEVKGGLRQLATGMLQTIDWHGRSGGARATSRCRRSRWSSERGASRSARSRSSVAQSRDGSRVKRRTRSRSSTSR